MSAQATEMQTNNPEPLEQRVAGLELRVSQVEDPMQAILENVLHMRKVQDEQSQSLLKIADHLGIDPNPFGS